MTAPKNQNCPYAPASLECLGAAWPNGMVNICQQCAWWDEFCRCPKCKELDCVCGEES